MIQFTFVTDVQFFITNNVNPMVKIFNILKVKEELTKISITYHPAYLAMCELGFHKSVVQRRIVDITSRGYDPDGRCLAAVKLLQRK